MTMWIGKCCSSHVSASCAAAASQRWPGLSSSPWTSRPMMVRLRVFGETSATGEGAAGGLCATITVGSGWAEPSGNSIVFGDLGLLDPPLRLFVRRRGVSASGGALSTRLAARSAERQSLRPGAKGAVSAVGEAEIRRGFEGFAVF